MPDAGIARVVIVPSTPGLGVLDYAVGRDFADVVRPGVRVLVPLGRRRAIGVVLDRTSASTHPYVRPIAAVLDPEPLLDDRLLALCRWMADYYLANVADAVGAALPGAVRVTAERVVTRVEGGGAMAPPTTPDTGRGAATRALARKVLDALGRPGTLPYRTLIARFGKPVHRAITVLRAAEAVRVEDRVREAAAPTRHIRWYRAAQSLAETDARAWERKRPAQYALYAYLRNHPLGRARATELATTFPNLTAKLNALVQAGLVRIEREESYRTVLPAEVSPDRPVALTPAQAAAVASVSAVIGHAFRTFLLWGVTGSGKTEVYLRCIAVALDAGRTALVLVPEISLTHQLVDRIRARFGDRVAVLHSGLSDGERWDEWRRIARGEVAIVVGARSAVFAPLPRLGLVVVDEEHDAAYKQEDGVRYNGRDVAVMRAKHAGCPAILGSATPAMETFHNGLTGRYGLLELPHRVEARPLPGVDIVDLRRHQGAVRGLPMSPKLAAALQGNHAARGQSLIFLNRRGFANFLQCVQCGEPLMCPNCSVTLTLHRRWSALRCHHCEYSVPIPSACPGCGGLSLTAWGAGTEQVESALRAIVPGARIARMDRDTTRRKGALERMLLAWQRREYDILVGTQMVTKGHDVPGVTLVGVLLADMSLNFPDFRAAERTFQLLTQVAGRAGRGDRPGRVIVQTLQPEHPSLACAEHHDYRRFAELELAARRELGYPPFARLVQLRCEGESATATERIAHSVAAAVRTHGGNRVGVLGPTPAPLERLRRRFRWQLLVRGRDGAAVRAAARAGVTATHPEARAADVRIAIDVDPYSML